MTHDAPLPNGTGSKSEEQNGRTASNGRARATRLTDAKVMQYFLNSRGFPQGNPKFRDDGHRFVMEGEGSRAGILDRATHRFFSREEVVEEMKSDEGVVS